MIKKSCPFIEDINAALKNLTDVYSTRAVNLVVSKILMRLELYLIAVII